jgi:hypothetical protein
LNRGSKSLPAVAHLDFGDFDTREGHFTIHRSLLEELPVRWHQLSRIASFASSSP